MAGLACSYANVMYSVWGTLVVDPWTGIRRVIRRRSVRLPQLWQSARFGADGCGHRYAVG